jgi:TetR/AcrR family transcriptional regulator
MSIIKKISFSSFTIIAWRFWKENIFSRIDLHEKDIFERLRQTCLLKIQVMQKYPWIFDFIRVAVFTDSEAVKDELLKRRKMVENSIFERFYGDIDTSRFRSELDVEKANN